MDTIYREFENMLHNLVWRTSEKYPEICTEELLCEANFLFLKAVETHDESRSKLGTWINNTVTVGLNDFSRRHDNCHKRYYAELPEVSARSETSLQDVLEKFEGDAMTVVSLVLTAPEEFTRGMVREILKDMGWVERRIAKCLSTIRAAV